MQKEIINLAFIGSGNWAQRYHFPALATLQAQHSDTYTLKLRGITSLEYNAAQAIAHKYNFEHVYRDTDALLADPAVTAIAVAVTPEALKDVLTHIIQRQLPIFSEKPPGISAHEAQLLSDVVTVPNVVAFNRRFIPLNQTFRKVISEMQNISFVEGNFYRHARLDETFMIGTGIHWINFIEYLFGPIARVNTHRWKNPENDSWLRTANVTFDNGLKGFLKFFPCSGSDYERVEVHSNKQSVYLDGPLWTCPGKIIIDTGIKQQIIKQPVPLPPDCVRLGIVGEYQAFFDLITKGTASPSTFQNAVNGMRVAEAMEHGLDL